MPVKNLMQQRRGTAAEWTTANPVLSAGEIGVETDTLKVKVGNGSTAWGSLEYTTDWANLTNVPGTFAPSAHTHLLEEITDYTPPVIPEVTFTNNLMLMGA